MARTPIHPGEIGTTAQAGILGVPANRLDQILAGKRRVTADTALRLSQYFGMSADFWMNLQSACELDAARREMEPHAGA